MSCVYVSVTLFKSRSAGNTKAPKVIDRMRITFVPSRDFTFYPGFRIPGLKFLSPEIYQL